jgi:nucleoside phosphorylase
MDPALPAPPIQPATRDDFKIAIICALPLEATAVESMFDRLYENRDHIYGKEEGDDNSYTTGVIGHHNVVLTHMPGMGKRDAASVAAWLKISFRRIELGLIVGVCGGVPREEILLGDVIISKKAVQIDFGRQYPDRFEIKDTLGQPDIKIRGFLSKLEAEGTHTRVTIRTHAYLKRLCLEKGITNARYPGADEDKLYKANIYLQAS